MQKPVPAAPGAASTAPAEKFYIAKLLSEHDDQLSALLAYGFAKERAQLYIAEADLNSSQAIVIAVEGKTTQFVVAPCGSRWGAWQATLQYLHDTEAEARAYAEEVERQLAPAKITLAIFSYVAAASMGSKQ